jgi:hypothetical protein
MARKKKDEAAVGDTLAAEEALFTKLAGIRIFRPSVNERQWLDWIGTQLSWIAIAVEVEWFPSVDFLPPHAISSEA